MSMLFKLTKSSMQTYRLLAMGLPIKLVDFLLQMKTKLTQLTQCFHFKDLKSRNNKFNSTSQCTLAIHVVFSKINLRLF